MSLAATSVAKSAEPVRTPSVQPGLLGGMSFDVQIETAPDIQFQSTLTENIQVEANLHLRGTASNRTLLGRSTSRRANWRSSGPNTRSTRARSHFSIR